MHQRLELRRHHEVDEEDREQQHELQRAERVAHVLALARQERGRADRHLHVGDDVLRAVDRGSEVALRGGSPDDRDALLADATDSAGPTAAARRPRRSAAPDTLPGLTIRLRTSSIEAARVSTLRTSTSIFLSTSDSAWRPRRARCSPRGRRCRARRGPSWVARSWSNTIWISGLPASTVDLMSAKRGRPACAAAPARRRPQALEVVARDDDLERCRQREQARAAELVLHAGSPSRLLRISAMRALPRRDPSRAPA